MNFLSWKRIFIFLFSRIHLFVEVLDDFFKNVCELDLVFNFYKCYSLLDEFCLAGELQETSKVNLVSRLERLDKLE